VLLVLVAALQAASPDTAVVMGSRLSVPPPRANKVLGTVTKALRQKGLGTLSDDELNRRLRKLGMRDTAVCAGKRPCLIELGKQLHVAKLVAVSVAYVKPDFSVSLELIEVESGKRGASASGVLDPNAATMDRDLAGMADELLQVLAASAPAPEPAPARTTSQPAPEQPSSQPQATLTPAPAPEQAPAAATAEGTSTTVVARPRGHRPLPWLLAGGAVLLAGGAVVGFYEAFQLRDKLWMGMKIMGTDGMAGMLTDLDAVSTYNSANAAIWSAIGASVIAAFLAVAAVWFGTGDGG
jgi:hypothetical protein